MRRRYPFVETLFADGGYAGEKFAGLAAKTGRWRVEVVAKPKDQVGFAVLPIRWVVERSFGWLGWRRRRLNKHVERSFESAIAFTQLALLDVRLRRLATA